MQVIEELLRTKKIKVTPQRMAVYAVLQQAGDHPNVEMIYKKLKPNYPAISLATVYKTVDILKKVGLIQELNIGEGGLRYDSNPDPHAHVYCKNCGKVSDLHSIFLEQLQNQLPIQKIMEKTGFQVFSVQLYFYGLCRQCQHKTNNTTPDQ